MYKKEELLTKLVSIRKKTKLNQEEFYKEYLKDLRISDTTSDASFQGYMRDLENGKKPIIPEILITYAKIGNCSIDALIGLSEEEHLQFSRYVTFSDLISDLLRLFENEEFTIDKTSSGKQCITFENPRILDFLGEIKSISQLKKNNNYKSIYDNWKKGVLGSGKYALKKDGYYTKEQILSESFEKLDKYIKQKKKKS